MNGGWQHRSANAVMLSAGQDLAGGDEIHVDPGYNRSYEDRSQLTAAESRLVSYVGPGYNRSYEDRSQFTAEENRLLMPFMPLKWTGGFILRWDPVVRAASRWSTINLKWQKDTATQGQLDACQLATAEHIRHGTGKPSLLATLQLETLQEELSAEERLALAPLAPLRMTGSFLLAWDVGASTALRWSGVSQDWREDPGSREYFDSCPCAIREDLEKLTGDPGIIPSVLRMERLRAAGLSNAPHLQVRRHNGQISALFGGSAGLFDSCCRGGRSGSAMVAVTQAQNQQPSRISDIPDEDEQLCPKGHSLMEFETPVFGWTCSICSSEVCAGSILRQCRRCNFDACETCFWNARSVGQWQLVRSPLDGHNRQDRGRFVDQQGMPRPEPAHAHRIVDQQSLLRIIDQQPPRFETARADRVSELPGIPDELPDDEFPNQRADFIPRAGHTYTAATSHVRPAHAVDPWDDRECPMDSVDELSYISESNGSEFSSRFRRPPHGFVK